MSPATRQRAWEAFKREIRKHRTQILGGTFEGCAWLLDGFVLEEAFSAALAVDAEPQEQKGYVCPDGPHVHYKRTVDERTGELLHQAIPCANKAAAPSLRPGGHGVYREALVKYGWHLRGCPLGTPVGGDTMEEIHARRCSCGFYDALTAADAAAGALPTCPGIHVPPIWAKEAGIIGGHIEHCPTCRDHPESPRGPAAGTH